MNTDPLIALSNPELVAQWNLIEHSHLSCTLTALERIPLSLQAVVRQAADRDFMHSFFEMAPVLLESGPRSIERQPMTIANSAKLSAFSLVGHLSFLPWHVIGGELSAELSKVITEGVDHLKINEIISRSGAVNLFVAAKESDDRESYIRSCRALLGRIKVARIVLDAELISFIPSNEFVSLCDSLGLGATFVGVSERSKAKNHSFMGGPHFKGVCVDTEGRQLKDAPGAAADAQDELISQSMQPSAQTHSRINALKSRQAAARRGP